MAVIVNMTYDTTHFDTACINTRHRDRHRQKTLDRRQTTTRLEDGETSLASIPTYQPVSRLIKTWFDRSLSVPSLAVTSVKVLTPSLQE